MSPRPPIVLITMRADDVRERRDALDQAWYSVLEKMGTSPCLVPNAGVGHAARLIDELKPALILLTGGNDLVATGQEETSAPERDEVEATLIDHAANKAIPLFGVCRGMQMLVSHYGGSLRRGTGHAGTQHGLISESSCSTWSRASVNSFHDWVIHEEDLPAVMEPLARADDGTIEAVRHRTHPQMGVLWHPERMPRAAEDVDLIRSFMLDNQRG